MIFSKEKTTLAYTIEKCLKCEKLHKRDFSEGDILFAISSKCTFVMVLLLLRKYLVKF
jgi:hypothetical protein